MSLSLLLWETKALRIGPGSQLGWPPNHTPMSSTMTPRSTMTHREER